MLLIPVKTQIVIYPQGKDAENSMWTPYVGKTGVLDGYYNAEEWCYVVLDVSTLSTAWCHVSVSRTERLAAWLAGGRRSGGQTKALQNRRDRPGPRRRDRPVAANPGGRAAGGRRRGWGGGGLRR